MVMYSFIDFAQTGKELVEKKKLIMIFHVKKFCFVVSINQLDINWSDVVN
jgi:hypothetical protein